MTTRFHSRYRRQHILLSSDNEVPNFEDLPPSDPPSDIETDDEQIYVDPNAEDNPFLNSNEAAYQDIPIASSDDFPLQNNGALPTSEDIPLASLSRNSAKIHHYHRNRSSLLPTSVALQSDNVIFTPRTERHH